MPFAPPQTMTAPSLASSGVHQPPSTLTVVFIVMLSGRF
jgi:hypothetical protein